MRVRTNTEKLGRFHGRKSLLSTSNDNTLRVSWIQRDIQCLAMGQRSLRKRSEHKKKKNKNRKYQLPRIKAMDSRMSKSRYWSNVVTVHGNDNKVRLWSTSKLSLSEKVLEPLPSMDGNKGSLGDASCAVISGCGHFVYIGRTSGFIDKYNIQSARHRLQTADAHRGVVRSLHLSLLNNVLISLGADGLVKFWNVSRRNQKAMSCRFVVELVRDEEEVIARSCYDERSNVLALSTDNLRVYLLDGANGELMRKWSLSPSSSSITEMIFSPRCQWLLISTMDGSLRVYDLMSGLLIDWFRFEHAVTSMSFSCNNTFLATTHCNTMGIVLWANKHHFSEPFLETVGNTPILMDAQSEHHEHHQHHQYEYEDAESSSSSDGGLEDILDLDHDDSDDDDDGDDDDDVEEVGLPDIASLHLSAQNELITLSLAPKSVWKNMANWDQILQRNRPSVKLKKNIANIPFFIPTKRHHRHIEMDTEKEHENERETDPDSVSVHEQQQRLKILKNVDERFKVDLAKCNAYSTSSRFIYFAKSRQSEMAREYLLSLGPSASDAEIHSIGINLGTAKSELALSITFLIKELESNRNFEHIQSLIALFLKVHSDLIIRYALTLNPLITKMMRLLDEKWEAINALFQSNLCLIRFYSHIQQ